MFTTGSDENELGIKTSALLTLTFAAGTDSVVQGRPPAG